MIFRTMPVSYTHLDVYKRQDQACVDACLKMTPLPNSQLSDRMAAEHFCDHHDHFENTTPNSEYKTCLAHAEKIGLGTREYELIFMK